MPNDNNRPTRQDQWAIIVHYQGNSIGYFDKKSGGAVDSDDTKYYPGDMADPISLGGRRTTDNVTLQRIYDGDLDHTRVFAGGKTLIQALMDGAGKSAVTVTQRPKDRDGNGFGQRITWNGILKRVLPPETDSESSSAAMLEIEIAPIGTPTMT